MNSYNVDTLDCKHSSHKQVIVAYCHQSVPKLECSFDNQPVILDKKSNKNVIKSSVNHDNNCFLKCQYF